MNHFTYNHERSIAKYLSQPAIREVLGVDHAVPQNFSNVGWAVNSAFTASSDEIQPSQDYVGALLDRGIRVLVYAGNYDAIANWVGIERFTLELDWTGKEEYGSQAMREWKVDDAVVGLTRSARGLTFATIYGAGHMVCLLRLVVVLRLTKDFLRRFRTINLGKVWLWLTGGWKMESCSNVG